MDEYEWESSLVDKISLGISKEDMLLKANSLMREIFAGGGESAQARYLWYIQHQKEFVEKTEVFSGLYQEDIAAQSLVLKQMILEAKRLVENNELVLNMTAFEHYVAAIRSEALEQGNKSIHDGHKWMNMSRAKRLSITEVPDPNLWWEYTRAWTAVKGEFTRYFLEEWRESGGDSV